MSNTDATRVEVIEEGLTFISPNLTGVLKEIDSRFTGAGLFVRYVRDVNDLLLRIEYFRDQAKTIMAYYREFNRISGESTGILLIESIVDRYYEKDGVTLDSSVSSYFDRDMSDNDRIFGVSSYFSGESEC